MKLTITIDIPEDFKQICEIFNFDPTHVIQAFTNEVSFPVFYSQPNNHHRWANFFFLDYLGATDGGDAEKWEAQKPYMDRMIQSISRDSEKSEKAIRSVMEEWHEFNLNQRNEVLLIRLKEERKD